MDLVAISNEKRFNEIKTGETFKRSETYSGTVTYKKIGNLQRSSAHPNEYFMRCTVIACTLKNSYFGEMVGKDVFVTSVMRYGKLGKVKIVK